MASTRKIAVNVTYDCDLDKVHKKVVDFLFQKGEKEYATFPKLTKIDYYICHSKMIEPKQEKKFINSHVYYTPCYNEKTFLKSIEHDWNKELIQATGDLCRMLFRSQVNSTVMQKNIYNDIYDCVINYSDNIENYKMNRHLKHYNPATNKIMAGNSFFIENNLFYCNIISPMWPEIDYSFFVTTQPTFFRVVMFWQFIRLLDDWTWGHDWWKSWKNDPDSLKADGFILPCWFDMQGIYTRSADAL